MNVCVMDHSAGTTCIEIQGPKSRRILAADRRARRVRPRSSVLSLRQRQGRRHRLPGRASRRHRRARIRNLLRRRLRLDDVRCLRAGGQGRRPGACAATGRSALSDWKKSITSTRATSTRPPIHMRPVSVGRSSSTRATSSAARRSPRSRRPDRHARWLVSRSGTSRYGRGQESDSERAARSVGHVTVVGFSPTLKKAIGLGYVSREAAGLGNELTLTSDSGTLSARTVAIPFFDPKGTQNPGVKRVSEESHRGLASVPATARSASVAFICPRPPVSCRSPAEHVRALERQPAPAE